MGSCIIVRVELRRESRNRCATSPETGYLAGNAPIALSAIAISGVPITVPRRRISHWNQSTVAFSTKTPLDSRISDSYHHIDHVSLARRQQH